MSIKPKLLDLFSGAGGMSLGFTQAGFEVLAAVDNWRDALGTFALNDPNAKVFLTDMSDLQSARELFQSLPDVDVVIGGPPCQGFSIAGKRDPLDPRNMLYKSFVDAIRVKRPKAFVMENVPTIASPTNAELFAEIIEDFKSLGYLVEARVLRASEYYVPQNRRRMFIVGTRSDIPAVFEFPKQSEVVNTTSDAISDLPDSSIDDGSPYPTPPLTQLQMILRKGSDYLYNHQVTEHSIATRSVISLVPDGGNYKDLPASLQGIRNVNIAWTRFSSDKPSNTIDTGHRHHFHYKYNRVPTVREAARLQSFPDSYIFLGSKTSQMKQVGNAVPPMLAKLIAENLYKVAAR
jgi:DNA (cytosine-5)-methyltransferase 1